VALRRQIPKEAQTVGALVKLIEDFRVQIIGPVRQEVLSGIKTEKQFRELRSYLSAFPDLPLQTADFEQAAEFFNASQRHGIQGSNTDFLICSVSYRRNLEIFTSDKDFMRFQTCIPIKLYLW
jgi:predicted nucleic acid-binding protein